MPRRLPPHTHWDPQEARRELRGGVELTLGEILARAAAVPLFRRNAAGALEQAVRVWICTPVALPGASVSVSAGEQLLDRQVLDLPVGETVVHLFVPEVTAASRFRVAMTASEQLETTAEIDVGPQRKWTVFLVHHSHFDYGYTDPQAIVMEQQLCYLDAALELIQATDGWPEDATFRWNVEATYPLECWLAARPRSARDEFVKRAQEGRIEVTALPFNMHTEVYSLDELAWGFHFADDLRDRFGLEIVSAIQTDVPGATQGLLTLLLGAGIRYLAVAHNYAGRSVPFLTGGQELTRPFWWRAPNGGRLLVWQTDTPHGVAYMEGNLVGLAEGEPMARGLLPDYLLALAERPWPFGQHAFGWRGLPEGVALTKCPYHYDILHLRVQSMIADNAPPSLTVAETVRDWNARWAFPRLRMATNREFFEEVERRYGDRLDAFEGDWTDWWVDGVGSGALPLGLNRRAQRAMATGRTLHALADVLSGDRSSAAAVEVDQAYEDAALFDEHTWGAANPWEERLEQMGSGALQWQRKAAFALSAYERAEALVDTGIRRLADCFLSPAGVLAAILVVNPSAWARTDLVRVFLPAERVPPGARFALKEGASERDVPFAIEPQQHAKFRAKGQWLTFVAEVPPLGYARYDVVAGQARDEVNPQPPVSDPFTLNSRFYRVVLDPRDGYITSIIDRDTGLDLVDANAPFGFNEYIYDRYTSAAGFNHLSGRIQAVDTSLFGSRATAGHASLVSRATDVIAERVTLRLVAPGAAWLETMITVPRDVKRVEIVNRLQKLATMEKESVYFAFPFSIDDPDPEYEITGGVTSLEAPHIPGSARHMFAVGHWLALGDKRAAAAWATLEAPLVELGTIALPYAPFPPTIPAERGRRSSVYSWALNNLWDTNFPPAQGGEMTFYYAVSSDRALSRRELGMRTGAALSRPLVGLCLPSRASDRANKFPARGSFCTVSEPLVEVATIAPSRRGYDLVAFLHSLAPETVDARVRFPSLPVARMWIGTFLEREMREVSIRDGEGIVRLAPGDYVAVAIDLAAD